MLTLELVAFSKIAPGTEPLLGSIFAVITKWAYVIQMKLCVCAFATNLALAVRWLYTDCYGKSNN